MYVCACVSVHRCGYAAGQHVGADGEPLIDVDSDDFRALPPLLQHEVLSELFVKSRETSWSRLEAMVQAAPISAPRVLSAVPVCAGVRMFASHMPGYLALCACVGLGAPG
jgi:hypothetical protein